MSALLQVSDLGVAVRGGDVLLREIGFEIHREQTFALLGESGSGKSMTALSVMRLLPDGVVFGAGAVRFDGRDLLRLPAFAMQRVRGRRIAMIFQEPMTSLNPVMTAGAQVLEALQLHRGASGAAAKRFALETFENVGLNEPARVYSSYPHELSGGMKQRVMIAMAIAGEPELLIADEPTTALDVTIQAQVLDLLKSLQARSGMAILFVSHDLSIVSHVADRIAVMKAGRIVDETDVADFFTGQRHPYSRHLLQVVPTMDKRGAPLFEAADFRSEALSKEEGRAVENHSPVPPKEEGQIAENHSPLVGELAERSPAGGGGNPEDDAGGHKRSNGSTPHFRPASGASPDVHAAAAAVPGGRLLEIKDLKVHFPIRAGVLRRVRRHVKAVDGVSLRLDAGKTLALVGESGSGKTTVAKAVLGLAPVTAGSVRFEGARLESLRGRSLRAFRRSAQIVFQDPFSSMNPKMLVGEIIKEGLRAQGQSDEARMNERTGELLELVSLERAAVHRYPHEFSGGQRQRICIARALAVAPKLLICDEPTSALDVSVQAQILDLFRRLQHTLGLSYLFITHDLAVVSYVAHDIAVMHRGRIVEVGEAVALLDNPRHEYTRALLSSVPVIKVA